MTKPQLRILLVIASIIVVAAAVRFPSLRTSPPAYTDEAFYLNVAWEMAHGRATVSGISQWTFLSPFSTSPPLYHFVLIPLLLLFGKSLFVARVLTASIGVLTAASLTYIGFVIFRSKLAGMVMGLAYATIPIIVVNNRWAFPQNLAGFCLLWAAFFLWQYRSTGRRAYEIAGCLIAGAALTTTYWCWGFVGAIFFIYRGLEKKRAWQAIGTILALPISIIAIRALTVPAAFWADISSFGLTWHFVSNSTPLWSKFFNGSGQYFTRDPLLFLAIIGMLVVRPNKLRIFLLSVFFFSAIVLLTNRTTFSGWFYSGLTFTPLVLLGLGAGVVTIKQQAGNHWRKVAGVIVTSIVLYSSIQFWGIIYSIHRHTLATLATQDIPFITREDDKDIEQIANFINTRLDPDDFVIAPNTINWQLHARSVEAIWTACYEHQQEFRQLFINRFPAPIGIHNATYLVDDTLFGGDVGICEDWRTEILDTALIEHWPKVLSTGRYQVYQNPNPISTPK